MGNSQHRLSQGPTATVSPAVTKKYYRSTSLPINILKQKSREEKRKKKEKSRQLKIRTQFSRSDHSSCHDRWIDPSQLNFNDPIGTKASLVDRLQTVWSQYGSPIMLRYDADTSMLPLDVMDYLVAGSFYALDLVDSLSLNAISLVHYSRQLRCEFYRSNPYHNYRHAFDVFQFIVALLGKSGIGVRLSQLDQCTLLLAALGHDAEHPGTTNRFQCTYQTDLAKEFGENHPLERQHSRVTRRLLLNRTELLNGLNPRERNRVCRRLHQIILATDMARHESFLFKLRMMFTDPLQEEEKEPESNAYLSPSTSRGICPGVYSSVDELSETELLGEEESLSNDNRVEAEQSLLLMQLLIKAADVSNVCRPFPIALRWSTILQEEFFKQGDLEKQLNPEANIMEVMDREKATMKSTALGFYKNVALPLYEQLALIVPSTRETLLPQLFDNIQTWERWS